MTNEEQLKEMMLGKLNPPRHGSTFTQNVSGHIYPTHTSVPQSVIDTYKRGADHHLYETHAQAVQRSTRVVEPTTYHLKTLEQIATDEEMRNRPKVMKKPLTTKLWSHPTRPHIENAPGHPNRAGKILYKP